MSKYDVVIKRIDRKRHHGFRYEVLVYWDKAAGHGDVSWVMTQWGARREAKRIIKRHELPKEKTDVVEEYSLATEAKEKK